MPIRIQPYTEDRIPAVKEFNRRLAAGGISPEVRFPESNIPYWLPRLESRRIYQQYYLALEDEIVRGGFILKYQEFLLAGSKQMLAYYHLPVSEGIVNKKFAGVGVHMLRSAMKMEPELFALGMGGFDRPLPTMLKAMRWQLCAIPFFYRIHHPNRLLRQIGLLRSSLLRRSAARVAAVTGAGWLGITAGQWIRSRHVAHTASEVIDGFGPWSDEVWRNCSPSYVMIGNRDSTTLNILYPARKNFLCLRVGGAQRPAGWAVLLDTQMNGNKYFGDLRVGSIADCLARPENASIVVSAATRLLEGRGVDLVIANHSHRAWRHAFSDAGFFQGPSNFIFAASPALTEKLHPFVEKESRVYLDRGDGDGPVNL